ncbi:MAG: tetratricopeptide repeat protein [Candidatus Altiarchaeota archaeon]|nr:tetratricopeptide repeat protein [Candidatus Altiarchaeota archaeon]
MPRNNVVLAALLAMLLLLNHAAAQATPRDEDIQFRWRYTAVDEITAFTAGMMNDEPVVVFSVKNGVYVLDKDGNPVQNYTIQTKGNIYVLFLGDVDADGMDEILLGVGWLETEEINLNKMYPPPDGIPEEEDLLYKILKSRGSLYVLDDGKLTQWSDVDQWVRSIHITDINGDNENETVIVSGGYTNNYYKKYTDIVYKHKYCWIAWDVDFEPYSKDECTCSGCFWDNETDKCYENETWEECDWNETIDKGWNLSERSSANGSILIYDRHGSRLSKSDIKGIEEKFLNAEVSNIYHDNDEEVVFGSGDKVYLIRYDGNVIAEHSTLGGVEYVYTSDVNGDENVDIVFSFVNSSMGVYGVGAISREGSELWTYYPNSSSAITAMYMKKVDTHGSNEVLFVLDGVLHVVNGRGRLAWSYQFKYNKMLIKKIQKLFSTDLDGDGLDDILFTSDKYVYDYEIFGTFIKKQTADTYFELGKEAYEANRYQEARTNIENARTLYAEANYLQDVLECDSILSEISEKLAGDRGLEADSHYANALTYYSTRDYEAAKRHINLARDIYKEINDLEGMSRCDTLVETINEVMAKKDTTTTVVVTSTTLTQGADSNPIIPNENMPIILLALLLIVGILVVKRGRRSEKLEFGEKPKKTLEIKLVDEHEEKKEEPKSGLMKEWESLEEHWKKLEEI